ncbi:MAG TPA: prephenate dehydrogenase/arogenate dehydrogenase family protein [Gammaproteobacteria bacterium]|nr:prephenate dehydrogenase/arogenate dehydrogenase family protein [Gammaproteobacteria bacterium]
MNKPLIDTLAVIGVGLIGGSLARALREAGQVRRVVGCGRGRENLERALALGVIDAWTHDPAEAVREADMVFVAVPLGAMRGVFSALCGALREDAVVTDGGSAKASVIADFAAACPQAMSRFVPGHPIAGTERNGVEAAFAELYRDRRVILTPTEATDGVALARVSAMWSACGAEVVEMDVARHDEVLAATSHLPHMLAFGLVDALARMEEHDDIFRFAAGGFRDFTRIASSNPTMWRDICIANREALGRVMRRFVAEMDALADSIEQGDGERLLTIFERAKTARDAYVDGLDRQRDVTE